MCDSIRHQRQPSVIHTSTDLHQAKHVPELLRHIFTCCCRRPLGGVAMHARSDFFSGVNSNTKIRGVGIMALRSTLFESLFLGYEVPKAVGSLI